MTGHLWVIGDSWADPSLYPWSVADGWPQMVAARLGLGVVNSAASGAGYASNHGTPYPVQAARGTGHGAAAVLVWGSLNDPYWGCTPEDTARGADLTYALVRRSCPDAALIVAGPAWGDQEPPDYMQWARATVRRAAADAGAVFVDPLGWLSGRPDLVLPDHLHPNQPGHALVADRLVPELLWALQPSPPEAPRDWGDEGGWVSPYTLGVPAGTVPAPSLLSEP